MQVATDKAEEGNENAWEALEIALREPPPEDSPELQVKILENLGQMPSEKAKPVIEPYLTDRIESKRAAAVLAYSHHAKESADTSDDKKLANAIEKNQKTYKTLLPEEIQVLPDTKSEKSVSILKTELESGNDNDELVVQALGRILESDLAAQRKKAAEENLKSNENSTEESGKEDSSAEEEDQTGQPEDKSKTNESKDDEENTLSEDDIYGLWINESTAKGDGENPEEAGDEVVKPEASIDESSSAEETVTGSASSEEETIAEETVKVEKEAIRGSYPETEGILLQYATDEEDSLKSDLALRNIARAYSDSWHTHFEEIFWNDDELFSTREKVLSYLSRTYPADSTEFSGKLKQYYKVAEEAQKPPVLKAIVLLDRSDEATVLAAIYPPKPKKRSVPYYRIWQRYPEHKKLQVLGKKYGISNSTWNKANSRASSVISGPASPEQQLLHSAISRLHPDWSYYDITEVSSPMYQRGFTWSVLRIVETSGRGQAWKVYALQKSLGLNTREANALLNMYRRDSRVLRP